MARPQSNFDFIDERFRDLATLRRVLSLVRQSGGQTIVIERLQPSRDLAEENEDIRQIRLDLSRSTAFRLSFFGKSISNARELSFLTDADLIGYTIVKVDFFGSTRESRIYESVVRPPARPKQFHQA